MSESGALHRVAKTSDLQPGQSRCLQLGSRAILLCQTAEGYYAIDNECSHAMASLAEGKLKGNRVFCPLHGAAFDVRDGSALTRPASIPLQTYEVHINGDDILIALEHNT